MDDSGALLFTMTNGDQAYRYYKSIVVRFAGARKTISTSILNGGYREDLTSVFNHDCNPGAGMACTLRAPTYKEHLQLVATELGLDPVLSSGLGTAASMENVAICQKNYEALTVAAIVTGGVEVNGGRAGDPATYYEPVDKSAINRPGTINILLLIDADLPPGTLTRALVTATEAKTAVLQELMIGSNYSSGLATGSGTDGIIAVANPSSSLYLEGAGKHTKLGELIGVSVKEALAQALYKQTGVCGEQQASCLRRFKRFGLDEETLWERYRTIGGRCEKAVFLDALYRMDRAPDLVVTASMYIHLLDQFLWRLISGESACREANLLLHFLCEQYGLEDIAMLDGYTEVTAIDDWQSFIIAVILQQTHESEAFIV